MNKKGFTLIEIIVTIGLLALLGVGIGVSLTKVLKNQEENSYETFIEKVKSSTLLYISNNSVIMNDLEINNGYILIPMQELINTGYVKGNLKNPNTNEEIKGIQSPDDPTGKEDYSKARVYYTMDKEMVIEYPYIMPSEKIYLNVMNYTTMYKTPEKNLCYKGLNTSSLGLIDSNGKVIQDSIIKLDLPDTENSKNNIIAYMEDGSKCTDSVLNTSKVGTYKIKYVYTIDGSSTLNNPNAKSETRNIIIKPTKPSIIQFDVVPQNDSSVYIAHFTGKAKDDSGLDLQYCYNYDNDKITDCTNWKTLKNNSFDEPNVDLHSLDSNVENKSQMKFYLFVKNPFEEYDVKQMSSNNGIYMLTSTLVLHLDTHNNFTTDQKFYTNINMTEEIPDTVEIKKITNNLKLSEVLNGTSYGNKKYNKPITRYYYFQNWIDKNDNTVSNDNKIFGVVHIYAKWIEDRTEPSCSINIGSPLSVVPGDTGGGVAKGEWIVNNQIINSTQETQHTYEVTDYAGNSSRCGMKTTGLITDQSCNTCYRQGQCYSWDCDCGGGSFCCCRYEMIPYQCCSTYYTCSKGYSKDGNYCYQANKG